MKLISLNVALFEKNNLQLTKFFASQAVDILCLQEVTKKVDVSLNQAFISKDAIDQASPDLKQSFFAPIWILSSFEKSNFHGQKLFSFNLGGKVEFGNYLRTKFKILKGQNIFVQNHLTYVTDWSKWPEEDYRAVQVTDLEINSKKLRLLNYHGIWSKDKQGTAKTKQACELIKRIALEVDYPAIICGDFNLFPETESMQVFPADFTNLLDLFKIKTTRPLSNELHDKKRNVVDYILLSRGVKINNFAVLPTNVSDHLPLILDFDLE